MDDDDDDDDDDDADEHDATSQKKNVQVDASNFKFGGNMETFFSYERYGDDKSHESHMTYSQ
eukprot:10836065-Karenia_brevis.AAC.1